MPSKRQPRYTVGEPTIAGQGARIRKILDKHDIPSKDLAAYLGTYKMHMSRLLTDRQPWPEDFVPRVAQFLTERGIPTTLEDIYIPYSTDHRLVNKNTRIVDLRDLLESPGYLLDRFVGLKLDEVTRDWVVLVLKQVHDHVEQNRPTLERKYRRQQERQREQLATRASIEQIAKDHELWPYQLEQMFTAHGNYQQYQEEFDHYYRWYQQPDEMKKLIERAKHPKKSKEPDEDSFA